MWPDDDAAVARRRMREAEREAQREFHRFCLLLVGLALVIAGLMLFVAWL